MTCSQAPTSSTQSSNNQTSSPSLRLPTLPLHQTSDGSADFGDIPKSIDNIMALSANSVTGLWNTVVVDLPSFLEYNLIQMIELGPEMYKLQVEIEWGSSFSDFSKEATSYLKKPAEEQWSGLIHYLGTPEGLQLGFNIGIGAKFPALFEKPAPLPEINFAKQSVSGNFATEAGITNQQLVQRASTFADNFVPFTKNAGVTGTLKHEAATTLLKKYQNIYGYRGLDFKVSRAGSILDVLDNPNGMIYDWKFGFQGGKTILQLNNSSQMIRYQNTFGLPTQVIRP